MNEFKYVVKVKSTNSLNDFEKLIGIKLPKFLAELILNNNYGYPVKKTFEGDDFSFSIKCLLSLNKEDEENLFDFYRTTRDISEEIGLNFIPFAVDDYGNLICFVPNTDFVVYIDEETLDVFNTKLTVEDFFGKLV